MEDRAKAIDEKREGDRLAALLAEARHEDNATAFALAFAALDWDDDADGGLGDL